MKIALERLHNGIIKENPTFVLMLGMCPTLAVTTSAMNGLGMGLATTVVLVMSNLMISLLRKVIPNGVRMPAYIVIVASFVTIVQMLLHAYVTSLYDSLGIYITVGLTAIGIVRELIGAGTVFDFQIMPKSYEGISIFVLAPGAFLVLAFLCALQNKLGVKGANRHVKAETMCGGDCANCKSLCKEMDKEEKNNG